MISTIHEACEQIAPAVNFALGRHVFRCDITVDFCTDSVVALVKDCPDEKCAIVSALGLQTDADWRPKALERAREFKRHLDRLYP